MPRKSVLPTYYYLEHFAEFLKFIKGPCAALLNSAHNDFIKFYEALGKDRQCLIVRAINRKHKFIKRSSMQYAEISNVEENINLLIEHQWFTRIESSDLHQWFDCLTKAELTTLLSSHIKVMSGWPKAKLVEHAQELESAVVMKSELINEYLVRNTDQHINYFLYLYFGNCHGRLNQFSMRDLGVMRTRKEQAQVLSRFNSIEEAQSTFQVHTRLGELKQATFSHINEIHAYADQFPNVEGQRSNELSHRCHFILATKMLDFDKDQAIKMLSKIPTSEAQEKWVREAYKLGLKSEVEQALERIIESPVDDQLLSFAEDFLARKYKKKRTSVLTDMLRENSQTLKIDEMHKGAVEKGVVTYYKQQDYFAQRTENQLWRSIFGLLFWEEIYEVNGFGIANEFDHVPLSLKQNKLYEIAASQIETKLSALASAADMFNILSKQALKHYGKSNIVFRWKENLLALIKPFIEHCPLQSLCQQLRSMSQNWSQFSDGYPDIMVIEKGVLRFEEIKSEGDQLRRNQLLTIKKLKENGFDVRITNVEWTIDPMQPYVVVDIETTGGKAANHRITEVGMVKMVNDKIVDSWQSLINPQKSIPANITALTGIDNEMVRNAPLFVDVAQEIADFSDGCVFVAHNVNFDYGFIKEEFARIDRHFKRPKLCTVSQMRKYFKGLSSYSLANLTHHFGIDMQRHHRAMSDALAASALLSMINEKRISSQKHT